MELFVPLLQGSYGYLLIFQILVVASLSMLLLWLVVQRTRQGARELVMRGPTAVMPAMDTGMGADTSAPEQAMMSGENPDLENHARALEEENAKLRAEFTDLKPLQDKIKFLESKLLEYEILQEEIGTLGHLKIENEKLKEALVKAEAELNGFVKNRASTMPQKLSNAAPSVDAEPPPTPMSENPDEITMAPTPGGSMPSLDGLQGELEDLQKKD